jgi:hypothetical protein
MHHCWSKWPGQNGVSRETTTERRVNRSFTNAEVAEDLVEHVFDIDAAGQSAKGPGGVTQFFGDYLFARRPCSALRHGAVQGGGSVLKCAPVARARYDRRFANRKRFSSELG